MSGRGEFRADFGRTAADYALHRPGFPPKLFAELEARGVAIAGRRALDLGTGTGNLARALAERGADVVGLDPDRVLLDAAHRQSVERGLGIPQVVARAEDTGFPAGSFDLVTAGQCWHWLDGRAAAAEARRVTREGGALVVAHFDWLPLPGSVSAMTEALIQDWNHAWKLGGGDGRYPLWREHLEGAGWSAVEVFEFDVAQTFTHEGWLGRIRASSGVGASMTPDVLRRFDEEHAELLLRRFPEDVLVVPHRVYAVLGRR